MTCTQSLPQLPLINTQQSILCPDDFTQGFAPSSCCITSPNQCGTAAFRSPLGELRNFTALPNHLWPLESFQSPQYNQINSAQQQPWTFDNATSSRFDDQQDGPSLDHGLGIMTNGDQYDATEVPTTNGGNNFTVDQGSIYPAQNVQQSFSTSPNYQFSQPPTGWNGAYFCGTPNAADSATQPSASEYNTPFPTHEHSFQQPFLSPACCPDMIPNTVVRNDTPFKRPVKRQSSTTSGTPQTIMYPAGTPTVQASSMTWSAQSATPEWSDEAYSRGSLPLPQVILNYPTEYNVQPDMQMRQHPLRTVMTVPLRRKPHLRPSLSESCVPRLSSPARMRAASMSHPFHQLQHDYSSNAAYGAQLPLPQLLPSMLINSSPTQMSSRSVPVTLSPDYRAAMSYIDRPQQRSQPSSPPQADFTQTKSFGMNPVRQEPTFAGDIYTPNWRRRTPQGKWEGWCGYCKPGRWLDLKNSRYWEDKLRNHGVCARTKQRLDDPIQIRWISTDRTIIPAGEVDFEGRDLYLETRKREGLCGVCHTWIVMDGPRTKVVDRPVGWWMHAYKCHNDKDKAIGTEPKSV